MSDHKKLFILKKQDKIRNSIVMGNVSIGILKNTIRNLSKKWKGWETGVASDSTCEEHSKK